MKTIKTLSLFVAIMLILPLLASCSKKQEVEHFDGESNITFPIVAAGGLRINLKDNEKKFVVTGATMEIDDETMVEVFTAKKDRIIQIINQYFRGKTVTEAGAPDIKVFCEEITALINEEFTTQAVKRVILADYMVY